MATPASCDNCGATLRVPVHRRIARHAMGIAKGAVDVVLGVVTHESPRLGDDAAPKPIAVTCGGCGERQYVVVS